MVSGFGVGASARFGDLIMISSPRNPNYPLRTLNKGPTKGRLGAHLLSAESDLLWEFGDFFLASPVRIPSKRGSAFF